MITIIMDSNKALHMSTKGVIHQKENLVDKIKFLIPKTYDDNDLTQYLVYVTYIDKGNNVHKEELIPENELYNDYIVFHFTVDSELTNFAGDVDIRLYFKYQDNALYSDNMTLNIKPLPSWFVFGVSDEDPEEIPDVIDVDHEPLNNEDDGAIDVDDPNEGVPDDENSSENEDDNTNTEENNSEENPNNEPVDLDNP